MSFLWRVLELALYHSMVTFLKKFPGCLESICGVFAFLGCSEVLMHIECILLLIFLIFLPISVGCIGSETEPEL